MAEMDWTKTGYPYLVEALVVDQNNVDIILGNLHGFVYQGASVNENYNSDSRVQAKLSTIVDEGASDGYIKQARLRMNLHIPSRDYMDEFVTGYVSNISEKTEHGYTRRDYTIEGTIWGLLEHKIAAPVTVSKGAKLIKSWTSLMSLTRMQYSTSGAQDHAFTKPTVYEVGTSLGTILFELSSGYDRMDNNGHGLVTLSKYVEPSKREATRTIDFTDPRGLAKQPIELTSSEWEAPGRAIVTATVSKTDDDGKTTQEVIVGSYDAPASHTTSISSRGWLRARSDTYSGVSENPSKNELNTEAKKNWTNAQGKYRQWTIPTVFANYHAGEVVNLIFSNDEMVKVLIESVRTDFEAFSQDLTVKEV